MTVIAAVGGERRLDRIVETGAELASGFGDELVVLHVMPRDRFEELQSSDVTAPVVVGGIDEEGGIAYVPSGRSIPEYSLDEAGDDAAGVARTVVEETLGADRAVDVEARGRVGDPGDEILSAAEMVDARYIVVGGRKRSPVGKAVFGSVSQSVVLNADRPVVTVTEPAD